MTLRAGIFLAALLLLAGAAVAEGADERFPPPEFSGEYQAPVTLHPGPRGDVWQWVDAGVLLGAIGLGTVGLLLLRSRKFVLVVMLASLGYFGFVRAGCICPVGAVQNVAMAVGDAAVALGAFVTSPGRATLAGVGQAVVSPGYAIPLVVVLLFLLPLLVALAFGRTFCGAVCPLGAVQDVVGIRPRKVPGWVEHTLGMVPWAFLAFVALMAATGTGQVVCRLDPFVTAFRFSGGLGAWLLLGSVLLLGVFIARPYCRYLCPYGALLRVTSLLSWRHATISPGKCVNCRLCEDACPYGAIHKPTRFAEKRSQGKGRLLAMLALLPVLGVIGAVGGRAVALPLSQANLNVQLARHMWTIHELSQGEGILPDAAAEQIEAALVDDTLAHARRALFETGRSEEELFSEAAAVQARFRSLAGVLGALLGLVIGAKLVHLSVRRTRSEYTIDRGKCLSCGRCFASCPFEHDRRRRGRAATEATT